MGCRVATRSMRFDDAPVTVRLPFAASSVSVARQQLKTWMRAHGFSRSSVDDGRVVLSELVANSVRHAQALADGTILISWAHEGETLRISVTDGGSAGSRPRTVRASSSALSGRGMAIVEAIVDEWWTEQARSSSTIHARLSLV